MELHFLRPLYAGLGGYVSVYLDVSRAVEDAAQAVQLRWRAARERLAADGADEPTLAAVERLITDPARAAPGRAAFARAGRVLFTAPLPDAPRRELATAAPLPHLMPLLAQSPPQPPQLRVSADRSGGDLIAFAAPADVTAEHVDGSNWPVHKTSVGGWAQDRYQRSVERAWEANAQELAAAVQAAAEKISAELIVIGGDVHARELLRDRLPTRWRDVTVLVDREVPADSDLLAQAAAEAVRDRVAARCRERLDTFSGQLRRGQAVEGVTATLAALRDGQASDVLIADDLAAVAGDQPPAVTAWIGPEPQDLGATEAELSERGVHQITRDRADAALVRAIAGTGAELWFLPADAAAPREGIGALLRYPVP